MEINLFMMVCLSLSWMLMGCVMGLEGRAFIERRFGIRGLGLLEMLIGAALMILTIVMILEDQL